MKVLDVVDEKVIHIIYQQMRAYVSRDEVSPKKLLVEDLGVDSLDRVEISMAIEETFPIGDISDEDAESLITVQDVINYVKERTA